MRLGERLLSASVYGLGSDSVGGTDAHRLNSGQALVQDLAVKDPVLAKPSEDVLSTHCIASHCVSWVPAVYLLRPRFLGLVEALFSLVLNHTSYVNSLRGALCFGI